jgi:polysaccharide deacetylase family protein (PEP-CTERM system associated)
MAVGRTIPHLETQQQRNVLSVDVEDYFHVEAFSSIVDRKNWESFPSRVEANTHRLLDLFDETGVKATCFILGWVAERYPALVAEIVRRGHEPACHSYWHRLIFRLSPEEFRQDTLRAKDCIEQAAGEPVFGYRAPTFSITEESSWAPEVLAELGFRYDSSIFPVKHDVYGVPHAPRGPFRFETPSGPLNEYPMSTFRFWKSPNMPVAGGGYLRIFPYWYTRMGVHRAWKEGLPVITYVHPWEVDPEQPRMENARWKSRLRHYTNLSRTAKRLRRLVRLGPFSSFRDSGLEPGTRTFEWLRTKQDNAPVELAHKQ